MGGATHQKELHLEGVINGEEYIRKRVPPGRSLHGGVHMEKSYAQRKVTRGEKLHREKSFTWKEISPRLL